MQLCTRFSRIINLAAVRGRIFPLLSMSTRSQRTENHGLPSLPKRPASCFVGFLIHQKSLTPALKNKNISQVAQICREKWNGLSLEEKQPYVTQSKAALDEYYKQLAAYNCSLGFPEGRMVVRYDTSASPSTRARLKLRALLKKLNAPHSNFMPPFAFYLKEQYDESAQISTTRHPHTVPGTMVNDEDRAVMLKSETADTPSESSTGVSTQSKKSAHAKTHLVSWQRIMKEAGIKWSSLPESEKIAFHKKAEEMKNINRKAMIAWWETLSADERNLIAYSYARVKAVTTFEAPSRAPKGVCELCLRPIKTSQRPKSKTLLARKFPEGLPWSYIWKLEMKKETDEKRLSKKCNGEAERGMNVNT